MEPLKAASAASKVSVIDPYLASVAHNKMLVDWIKVFKPEVSTL